MSESDIATTLHQVRAAKAGDGDAFNRLLSRYRPIVQRLAALRVGMTERQLVDLEDVVQEALLAAFKGIDQFEEQSEGTFRDWLARIVENRIRDRLRYEGREKRNAGRAEPLLDGSQQQIARLPEGAAVPTPSEDTRFRELDQARQEALLSLEERYREVILLREECGMSYGEIAPRFGFRQEGPVRALYSRAIAKLRALLEDYR